MGLFRLLLAFFVVLAHTCVPVAAAYGTGGETSVRLFFVVSGFYMAMILTEKYTPGMPGRLWLFYSNRGLRIYPMLWMAVLAEVALALVMQSQNWLTQEHWLSSLNRMAAGQHLGLLAGYGVSQVAGLGVDASFLFSLTPDLNLCLYPGKLEGYLRAWHAYPMAHTWSISCELFFYLTAPFLVHRRLRTLGVALVAAVALTVLTTKFAPRNLATVAVSFWFPYQLGYFLLGIIACRVFRDPKLGRLPGMKALGAASVAGLVLCIAFYVPLVRMSYSLSQLLLFGFAVPAIPALFRWSGRSKLDRRLGELSYPVYLVHITVKTLLAVPPVAALFGGNPYGTLPYTFATMALACAVSYGLLRFVDAPIDAWRQARVRSGQSPARTGGATA